jgi:hypothetical protein
MTNTELLAASLSLFDGPTLHVEVEPAWRYFKQITRPAVGGEEFGTGWRYLKWPCGCIAGSFSHPGGNAAAFVTRPPLGPVGRQVCAACVAASPLIEVEIVSQGGEPPFRKMRPVLDFSAPYAHGVYRADTGELLAANWDSSG